MEVVLQSVAIAAGALAVLTGLAAVRGLVTAHRRFSSPGSRLAVGALALAAIGAGIAVLYESSVSSSDPAPAFGSVAAILGILAVLRSRLDRRSDPV